MKLKLFEMYFNYYHTVMTAQVLAESKESAINILKDSFSPHVIRDIGVSEYEIKEKGQVISISG